MNLQAAELVKDYKGGVRALDGVSLSAGPGEAVAVTGPSGSGKSTLLALLGGLDAPTSGVVYVDGTPLSSRYPLHKFRAERVGFVFQFHHLLPHLNLRENVETSMVALAVPSRLRRVRATGLLNRLGLKDRSGFLPTRVSGGERQRCAVARALVNGPDLILADEPTGNLDSTTGGQVIDILLEWTREAAATLIVATHDLEVARRADRRVQLRDGRLTALVSHAAGALDLAPG